MTVITATALIMCGVQSGTAADFGAFSVSQLQCVIGNNAAAGEHRAGYNGVFQLKAPDAPKNAFVPLYAGLNLEHYFDAATVSEDRAVFFEPRNAPMSFQMLDENIAELHQPTTPHFGVESWTRLTVKDPCYVDMDFRCVPRKAGLAGNVLGVFWASYINAPEDKSLYFLSEGSSLDAPKWAQYCTLQHGRDSTVCSEKDTVDIEFEGGSGALFRSMAPLRYSEPFFYGRTADHVLIFIFAPGPVIRFSHSPSGGGRTEAGDAQHPAWDFQLIIPDYEVGREYSLNMRLVYKPWAGRADVLDEVRQFLNNS